MNHGILLLVGSLCLVVNFGSSQLFGTRTRPSISAFGSTQNAPDYSGQYRADNSGRYDGQYYPDDSGQYRGDSSGSYRDDSGQYHPDDSGRYIHDDRKYEHQDVGGGQYTHQDVGGGQYNHQDVGGGQYTHQDVGGGQYTHQPDQGDKYRPDNSGGGQYKPDRNPSAGGGGGSGTGGAGIGTGGKAQSGICSYDNLRNYKIIKQKGDLGDGEYHYIYETENCMYGEERGQLHNKGTKDEIRRAEGLFYYVAPDNVKYTVTYTADENGFIAKGAHIHPTPNHVLRQLQYLKSIGKL